MSSRSSKALAVSKPPSREPSSHKQTSKSVTRERHKDSKSTRRGSRTS